MIEDDSLISYRAILSSCETQLNGIKFFAHAGYSICLVCRDRLIIKQFQSGRPRGQNVMRDGVRCCGCGFNPCCDTDATIVLSF
jgi:hypothetical protein